MSRAIGVEIGATRLRAVLPRRRGAPQVFDLPLTLDRLDEAVAELRSLAGDVSGIGLVIGLAHLHVKQVTLPPVAHAARRQMLAVEPERWFAMQGGATTAIALDHGGTIAMAADGALIESCVRAFALWAPVQRVDGAPVALVRALLANGVASIETTLEAGAGEVGRVTMVDGALHSVRRVRATAFEDAASSAASASPVEPSFLAAYGATLSLDETTSAMLLTPALEQRFIAHRRRRVLTWSVAAMVAVGIAAWSVGVARDRLLLALDSEVASARRTAREGTDALTRVVRMDRELAAISTTAAARSDVLAAFAAVGARLPVEAVAQRIRIVGGEWQLEGNATTAAAVLAALAAEPRFDKVRFLAPSTRFRDGTTERETFAIAFAVR
ncbi:MAG: hypothetical protein V4813_08105 [Gemmatimonadota bacterium]